MDRRGLSNHLLCTLLMWCLNSHLNQMLHTWSMKSHQNRGEGVIWQQSVSSRSRCIFWWGGPPSQSFAEDLPPAEPFRASLTMAGSAESPPCRCTVMSNTSKSEKHYQCVKVITGPTRLKALFHFWVINVNDCVWSIETLLIVVGKCSFCFM